MHRDITPYNPRAEAERRQYDRWLAASRARYERRAAGAGERIAAAEAKRLRRAAKRAPTA
jgi:hypothetical protein